VKELGAIQKVGGKTFLRKKTDFIIDEIRN